MAADNGGGLYNRGDAEATNLTFFANAASGPGTGGNLFNDTAQISFINRIIANSDSDGNCFNSEGTLTSLGSNIDSANTCGFSSTGDLPNTDPALGIFQDNGGPTPTHAPVLGSLAIDSGSDQGCPLTDQRGAQRPVDGDGNGLAVCDIGAVEYLSTPPGEYPRMLFFPLAQRTQTP
jgi:hypothetical protein